MAVSIQPAETSDLDAIVDLLMEDARQRQAIAPALWKIAIGAEEKIRSALKAAMENEAPPFREQWLLAKSGLNIVGITHSALVPVPPIYAGEFGSPGLIMEDSFVSKAAPQGTRSALLEAAEKDLVDAGATILLASSTEDDSWASEFVAQSYKPLTLYLAKSGFSDNGSTEHVRGATEEDVPEIVRSSAANRSILCDLNSFWKPHPDANTRFGDWMTFSLALTDRDLFVSESDGAFEGYIISQPVTPLHIPRSHDLSLTGIIDDYFHGDFEEPGELKNGGKGAVDLLRAAEQALQGRGCDNALVVCPAAWKSKIQLLESAGYKNAITWFIKR